MANPQVVFRRDTQANLPSSRSADSIYFTTDKGNMYLGSKVIIEKAENLSLADIENPSLATQRATQVPTALEVLNIIRNIDLDDVAIEFPAGMMVFKGEITYDNLEAVGAYVAGDVYKITDEGTPTGGTIEPGTVILFKADASSIVFSNLAILSTPVGMTWETF